MKIKAPDITATGVLAIAALAVGGYVVWRGSKVIGDVVDSVKETAGKAIDWVKETEGEAVDWVDRKVEAVKKVAIENAKIGTSPLSPTGILPPVGTNVGTGWPSQDQQDWQNRQLESLTLGGMGA